MKFATFDQEMIARDYWATIEESHNIGTSRHRRNVLYRHAFFTACREITQLSLKSIGKILNKDHATVLHALRSHEQNYRFDVQYRNVYTEILTCLGDIISTNADQVYEIVKNKALKTNPDIFNDHMVAMYKKKLENAAKQHEIENDVLRSENAKIKKHTKKLQKRVDQLNAECLRLKNLL